MRIAIVGCGFVADLYLKTLTLHPELELAGVFDRDQDRAQRFAAYHHLHIYTTLEELLADPQIQIVLNLTNPISHYQVSKDCLDAGKHVYSEKPLAMNLDEAKHLVSLAEQRGLEISSAPCSLLSETAQTLWKAIRNEAVGKIRVVYAEMDDGLVHLMPYRKWISDSGAPWPYQDEFETGCTLEHAGYCLTWLAGFFGPATDVTAFASVQIPDKASEIPPQQMGADFSVACIRFASGIVARLTCSLIAPHDHHLRIFGDKGILWTNDTWLYRSPVYVRKYLTVRRRMMLNPFKRRVPMQGTHLPQPKYRGASHMDFCRGIAEIADAVQHKRACRLSGQFSLHVNELALAIHSAQGGKSYVMTTTFEPMQPMPWAK